MEASSLSIFNSARRPRRVSFTMAFSFSYLCFKLAKAVSATDLFFFRTLRSDITCSRLRCNLPRNWSISACNSAVSSARFALPLAAYKSDIQPIKLLAIGLIGRNLNVGMSMMRKGNMVGGKTARE